MRIDSPRDYVVENLKYALDPSSIAVVGASLCPNKVGYKVIDGLQKWGYKGTIYPVNPRAEKIAGLTAYPTVADIPGPVDLVFVALPAHLVKMVLEQCVAKQVKMVVIATSAFKEIGRADMQDALTQYCRDNKLPMVGPNLVGMGILPIMVTVLVLILFESETLYHANQAKLPNWVVRLHPHPPDIQVIEEVKPHYYD